MKAELLVYYGHDPALLPRLRQCQVLVFESQGWSPDHLAQLRGPGGPRLLGYLSPFAWPQWAGPARWWWGKSQPDPEWNARWHSLIWPGWRGQVRRLAALVRQNGCDGIFLDNLDRLEADPRSLPHLLKILQGLRREWPDVYLLGNRGFAHWSSLSSLLDGVLVENMSDRTFRESDRRWVEERIRQTASRDVYALDYATLYSPEEARRMRELFPGLRSYVAPDQSLQTLARSPAPGDEARHV